MKFTDEQLAIINSDEPKILVKAGAGTGKTAVLTNRIVRLIDNNPDLSITDMAIITFTNKATEELQARLKKLFYNNWKLESDQAKKEKFRYEVESLNMAQISTIHKFCASILDSIGPYEDDDIIFSPNFKVRSGQLTETINLSIEEWIAQKNEKGQSIEHLKYMPVHRIKEVIEAAYRMIRSKGYNITEVIDKTRKLSNLESSRVKVKLKRELVELLQLVSKNHKKYKYGKLDVDDLLEYCAKILTKNPDIVKLIQQKYKYVFVDEFQDTSLYQADILKMICDGSENSPHLFVVGDIKQSIYEFRGADAESYLQMEKWIEKNGKIYPLSINFRSKPEVVNFVNLVFDRIKDNKLFTFKRDPLLPSKEDGSVNVEYAYEWILAEKYEDQSELIAQFIKKQIKHGISASDFTILVRKNYELGLIGEKLREYKIDYDITGSGNFYNQIEVLDIYKVLKAILNDTNYISKNEAANTIYFSNNTHLLEKIIINIKDNNLIFELTPSQILEYIFRFSKIFDRCNQRMKANLNKLKEVTRKLVKDENITLYQYANWLSVMITAKADEQLADVPDKKRERVTLMTIHKSKGLDFPIVIIPFLNQSISKNSLYPEIIYNQSNGSLEFCYEKYYEDDVKIMSDNYEDIIRNVHHNVYSEELRVLYVALTRAKNKLILVGEKSCDKKRICYQNWLRKED